MEVNWAVVKKETVVKYSKNPRARTWLLRTCYDKICQLGKYKNLFSLEFETGSYFLKSIKNHVHLGK